MTRLPSSLFMALLGLVVASGAALANEAPESFGDSLKQGKAGVSLRYRLEAVSDDAAAEDAEASTLRTTLSFRTAPYKKWSLFAEAENVTAVGDDNYRNLGAGSLSNECRAHSQRESLVRRTR